MNQYEIVIRQNDDLEDCLTEADIDLYGFDEIPDDYDDDCFPGEENYQY
ncbi:hypothetical protein Q9L42_021035 (plasmid) [Methylomarinum sp. Ch1-1]|uniref:Uncharacterized protein n=1 Tax=Methylomarinum roseum TaxID=3067653 RepID=A0AAU7P0K5_9GAMM|nr:hypothetical protein [Methylomarinum sp. Ch1-1]MDP4519010.1 hypothetical protein [Methylomarinum sp. Ch1-1]MDP4523409.1 hypothetical protein [Methylomarinum sp. Ch1-1]